MLGKSTTSPSLSAQPADNLSHHQLRTLPNQLPNQPHHWPTTIPNLSLVGSSDDHGPIAPASRVSFNAIAGTTYRIAVDGKAAQTGLIKLIWVMP